MKKHIQIKYGKDSWVYCVDGTKHTFSISGSTYDNSWAQYDKSYITLNDDGNGISLNLAGKKIRLNYMEVELIRLALLLNGDTMKLSEIEVKKFEGLSE